MALNVLASVILRMPYGSVFQAVGPLTENARSPSSLRVGGTLGMNSGLGGLDSTQRSIVAPYARCIDISQHVQLSKRRLATGQF